MGWYRDGHDVDFSPEFKALCKRQDDLRRLKPNETIDAETIAAMWDALALDFDEDRHDVLAESCRKNADRLRGVRR